MIFAKKSVKRSASYAAAKPSAMSKGWNPSNVSVNTIIAASTDTMRARIRQLVRDFPYFARAVNVLVDYIVGEEQSGDIHDKYCQVKNNSFPIFLLWNDGLTSYWPEWILNVIVQRLVTAPGNKLSGILAG
ncbi:MAG: phage portal protein [Desulfobacteraceae bacterium]|nr:phage portal protein [Desulfobacteraceae bacterium]